jgi:hypothetical protein
MLIPDSDFYPSRISDTTPTTKEGEEISCLNFFSIVEIRSPLPSRFSELLKVVTNEKGGAVGDVLTSIC